MCATASAAPPAWHTPTAPCASRGCAGCTQSQWCVLALCTLSMYPKLVPSFSHSLPALHSLQQVKQASRTAMALDFGVAQVRYVRLA